MMKKILLSLLLLVSLSAKESELTEAYLKEFTFLKTQKKALQDRLDSIEKEIDLKGKNAKKQIDKLQNRLIAKTTENERTNELLFDIEKDKGYQDENHELIEITIAQALSTLKGQKVIIDEKNGESKKEDTTILDEAFVNALSTLDRLSSMTKRDGEFYLPDGKKSSGTIVTVGNIASFGVSSDHSGVLAPAGEGHLKLWEAQEDTTELAKAVAENKNIDELSIFLYENLNTEATEPPTKTVISVINSGGVVGWVIVILGFLAVGLIVLRSFFLSKAGESTEEATHDIIELINNDDIDGAKEYIKSHEKDGSIIRILKATIKNIDKPRDVIDDIVSENMIHESGTIDKYGGLIMVIAAVAPLLGLLGTVTGMISTFDIITEFGTGDPKLLSGGISEALVTTELGLVVAIPALVFGNILGGWAENIKDDMEKAALKVVNAYKLVEKKQ
jgi:biopolymer transport protein ExbB